MIFPARRGADYLDCSQKGSNWFSIPEDVARYIVSNEPTIYYKFNDTYIPDEHFIQLLLSLNSSYKNRICNKNLRFVDWKRKRFSSPGIILTDSVSELLKSENLFARKFDSEVDYVAIT
ncbi:MAG: hypothetical protein J5494_08495 [Candidatus Methanomethylophilaceae archaeon]|nr:hypothetical protein [Candidatus Methanomethylophilaceae archaeon]